MIGQTSTNAAPDPPPKAPEAPYAATQLPDAPAAEIGGREGPDPTRFGDWEKNGRCIDF